MPKFSIAFVAPEQNSRLKHKIVEGADQDAALKTFFTEEVSEHYSADEQGYYYFKEDFFDAAIPSGSIIPC
jgi:tellurite resistance protein